MRWTPRRGAFSSAATAAMARISPRSVAGLGHSISPCWMAGSTTGAGRISTYSPKKPRRPPRICTPWLCFPAVSADSPSPSTLGTSRSSASPPRVKLGHTGFSRRSLVSLCSRGTRINTSPAGGKASSRARRRRGLPDVRPLSRLRVPAQAVNGQIHTGGRVKSRWFRAPATKSPVRQGRFPLGTGLSRFQALGPGKALPDQSPSSSRFPRCAACDATGAGSGTPHRSEAGIVGGGLQGFSPASRRI